MFKFLFVIFLILQKLISLSISSEVPIIVISAGKSLQSKGTVGTDIEILDSKILKESSIGQLGEAISDNISGAKDRKSTRLNSSHIPLSRMPSSA